MAVSFEAHSTLLLLDFDDIWNWVPRWRTKVTFLNANVLFRKNVCNNPKSLGLPEDTRPPWNFVI